MMCSVILVAGLWLNPCHVAYMSDAKKGRCYVYFSGGKSTNWNWVKFDEPCKEIARKINQLREGK